MTTTIRYSLYAGALDKRIQTVKNSYDAAAKTIKVYIMQDDEPEMLKGMASLDAYKAWAIASGMLAVDPAGISDADWTAAYEDGFRFYKELRGWSREAVQGLAQALNA